MPQVQVYATGGVEPVYGVKVDDAFGTILFQPKNFNSVEWTRARNSVGAATLILPGHWPASKVKRKDGIVEIWKQIGSAPPFLVTNTVWLRRGWKRLIKRGSDGGLEKLWAIRCFDLNHLIARRTVDYNAANDYTSKLLPADDMIKAIARENFGSLATDTDRSWADKIDIQADRSEAPVILKTFARRNMLQIFQEICRTSDELGVHLSFDIVVKVPPGIPGQPFKVELRTYTGQIGVDHTFPSGNPPITLGAERGNLDGVEIDESYEEEVTRGIVGGQGDEEFRPIARFTDDARVAESPFGLIESFEDSQQDTDGAGLSDEARALVNANGLHKSATGQLVPTSGVIFDIDVRWGDKVTVQADSESFDAHIDVAHGVFTREGEQVDVVIRSEA